MIRPWKIDLLVLAVAALVADTAHGQVTDVLWAADPASPATWNSDNNWSTFIPDVQFGEAAVFDNGGTAFINLSVPNIAQLRIDSGGVEIRSGGSLAVPDDLADPDFGITNVGIGGLGRLDILSGGQFASDLLTMGGDAASTLSLAGMAAIDINSDANLDRVTRIEGPNVTAEVGGDLRFRGTFVPVITGGTHSTIQVALGNASLGGTLRPEFGDGFVPAFGDSWKLVSADTVSGSFNNIDTSNFPTLPRGTAVGVSVVPSNSEDVVLSVSNRLILTVDRGNGALAVENAVGDPIAVDSYSIGSPGGFLDPAAWQSLEDSGVGDWQEANPSVNFLNELNPLGSSTLSTGDGPLGLGNAYSFVPTALGESAQDITFEYGRPDGDPVAGIVEYTGLENNLLLSVNTATGNATLTNDSTFNISLLGYSIESPGGSLDPATWNSLADQGLAGWQEANPTPNALNELNADSTLAIPAGTVLDLGALFDVGGSEDLFFEFLFESSAGPPGDTNGDNKVDIVDLNNVRNNFGGGPEGDTNGDGMVDIVDLNNVRNNFGAMGQGGGGEQGILAGVVKYNAGAAVVPEPATWLLLSIGLIGLTLRRKTMKLGMWIGCVAAVAMFATGAKPAWAIDIVVQAEDFASTVDNGGAGPFMIVADANAAGGSHITTGRNRTAGPPEVLATYNVNFPTTDPYHVYTRGNSQGDGGNDSFWLPADLGPVSSPPVESDFIRENDWAGTHPTILGPDGYVWVNHTINMALSPGSGSVQNIAGPYTPALAGVQEFVIGGREDGFRIDSFVFSTDDALTTAQLDALVGAPAQNPMVGFTIPAANKSFPTDHPLTGNGDGLEGTWWKFDTGNTLANAQAAAGTEPIDATFVATQLDYVRGPADGAGGGTAIGTFLSPDPVNIAPGSAQTTATSSNNSFWRFQGFIDIRAEHDAFPDLAGLQVTFGIPSDDATNLVIGGIEVLNNDGGHGFPGGGWGPVVVEFEEPGVYSLETFLTQGGGGFGLELLSSLPGTDAGNRGGLSMTPDTSLLFTQAGIFPDFNGDNSVDNLDYAILRDNFLSGTTFAQGDMNRNFRVDLEDFRKFRNAFNLLNAAPAAVPEPGSLVLLALSAAVCGLFRRRRRAA